MHPTPVTVDHRRAAFSVTDGGMLLFFLIAIPFLLIFHERHGLPSPWMRALDFPLAFVTLLAYGTVGRLLTRIFEGISEKLQHSRVKRVAELLEQLAMLPLVIAMGIGALHFLNMADRRWPVRHTAMMLAFALFGWGVVLILLGNRFWRRKEAAERQ